MPSRVSPEARFFAIAARCQPAVEIAQDPRRLAIVSPIELELALGSLYEAIAPYARAPSTGSFGGRAFASTHAMRLGIGFCPSSNHCLPARLRTDLRRSALRRREGAGLRGDRGEAARRAVPSGPPA